MMVSLAVASETLHLLIFGVAGRLFALEIAEVVEIISFQGLTRIPRPLPHVEGVIAYRDRVIPLINLRRRLGAPAKDSGPGAPILLLRSSLSSTPVGLLVDSVLNVIAVDRRTLLEPPPKVFGIKAEFIKGIANMEGRPVIWLDVARLLSTTDEIVLVV